MTARQCLRQPAAAAGRLECLGDDAIELELPSSLALNFIIPAESNTGAGPGLLNTWKEDVIDDSGVIRRYGYRSARMMDGAQVLDGWMGGNLYWSVDNPGISGTLVDGLRLSFMLTKKRQFSRFGFRAAQERRQKMPVEVTPTQARPSKPSSRR